MYLHFKNYMYTVYKLAPASSGLKFHFPSNVLELKC